MRDHHLFSRVKDIPPLTAKSIGYLLVISAYNSWGLLPLFWNALHEVPSPVVLTHRVFWSAIFLWGVLLVRGELLQSMRSLCALPVVKNRFLAALFLSTNWFIYIWAMAKGYFTDAGLGYFICPLITLIFARIIFKERLRAYQRCGIILVGIGVLAKILQSSSLPGVALGLALTWALYCTIKKKQEGHPLSSLYQEILLILPIVLLIVGLCYGDILFHWYGVYLTSLLVLSGIATALPIYLLTKGLQKIPLSSVALIQFLTPTLNLVVGIIMGEQIHLSDLAVYIPIGLGVLVFSGVVQSRTKHELLPALKGDRA